MNIDTIFDIASVTKIFTTTAILKLVSEKELCLDRYITEYVKFQNKDVSEKLKDIRIKDLLNHSSGLVPWYPFYTMANSSFDDALAHILSKEILKNGIVQYSDINFILLGKLIEEITKWGLNDSMMELVIKPLQMNCTDYKTQLCDVAATEYGNQIETKMVQDRELSFNGFRDPSIPIIGEVNDGNCNYYFNGVSGHAGLFSNIKDLDKLCHLYIQRGGIGTKSYIDEDIILKSFMNYGDDRGLGWQLGELYPGGVGHTGFTGSSIYIDLKNNAKVIMLTNRLHVDKPVNIADFRLAIHNKIHTAYIE